VRCLSYKLHPHPQPHIVHTVQLSRLFLLLRRSPLMRYVCLDYDFFTCSRCVHWVCDWSINYRVYCASRSTPPPPHDTDRLPEKTNPYRGFANICPSKTPVSFRLSGDNRVMYLPGDFTFDFNFIFGSQIDGHFDLW